MIRSIASRLTIRASQHSHTVKHRAFAEVTKHRGAVEARRPPPGAVSTAVRVAKTSYNLMFVAGSAVLCTAIGGTIVYSLFSGKSEYSVYDKSFERIRDDERVKQYLGSPVQGFVNGRQHRAMLSEETVQEGKKHVRIAYEIKGPYGSGVVHAEMADKEDGSFDFEYLLVNIPRRANILIVAKEHPEFSS